MTPRNPIHPTSNQIADQIRETVRKVQQSEQVRPPHHAGQETLVQAIRTLARNRVAQTLRQLRAVSGLSYEDVAAETGLSKQTLFDLEYKERRLSIDELRKIAACYHISENDILGVDILGTDLD